MNVMNSYTSIATLASLVKSKEVSPVALTKNCLERIGKLNGVLNAFITINPNAIEQAQVAAQEIERGQHRGPLHGILIGVKDFYDTAGMRTTAGSVRFKDRMPQKDAVVVKLLKEAGAIIIGKTNMHELGMGTTSHVSYFGSVHNPWNTSYVAGGSSGGSAAAVAAGLCYATVDTDAVGSCRLPASCCGVVGFKGTYGLISSEGILAGEKGDDVILKLAHPAITTRSTTDTAILLDTLANSTARRKKIEGTRFQSVRSVGNQRIGVVKNFNSTEEVKEIFSQALENIEGFGTMIDIEVPFASASFSVQKIDQDRRNISKSLFKDIDILLLPTVAANTPTLKEAEKAGPNAVAAENTFFCNYFALPAISVPCGFDPSGLPVGLQIVGRSWEDENVLHVAHELEKQIHPSVKTPKI